MVSLFLPKATLPLAVVLSVQASAALKSSCKMISPNPGRSSGVGGRGVLDGKGVRVGVGGNQTIVGVRVALGEGMTVEEGERVDVDATGRQEVIRTVKANIPANCFFEIILRISGMQAQYSNRECVVKLGYCHEEIPSLLIHSSIKEQNMRKKAILVTGASGEIGQAFIKSFAERDNRYIVAIDIKAIPSDVQPYVVAHQADIQNEDLMNRLVGEYDFEIIYHLAAYLSTKAEHSPYEAHRVNVEGTLTLLKLAAEQSDRNNKPVKFIFPSSIAAYGLPDLDTKNRHPRVKEDDWNFPCTMYGCTKLYCEKLGDYFCHHYRQLDDKCPVKLDFRCLRFPGLISAYTVPSGGTSDYGPEMLDAAAQHHSYASFVREDVRIPFMVMPDAIKSLLELSSTPEESLNRTVYNVTSFSLSADEFRTWVLKYFPSAQITFKPDPRRQAIVDSWPADTDDSAARNDWNWKPDFDVERSFKEYLVPIISQRYQPVHMPRTKE
jgi:threonine 3-dehydrogenase